MTKPHTSGLSLIPVSDIAAQLAERAEQLCRHLLPEGRREGSEWRCGSVRGEAGKSLGVHLTGAKAGVWSDFASGEGGDLVDLVKAVTGLDTAGAIRWAKSWLGIGDVERPTPAPRAQSDRKMIERSDDSAGRTKAGRAIWQASQGAIDTLVEKPFLRSRGITIIPPPTIRYHPGLHHRLSGRTLPAMVAGVQAIDGRITGVHRTYLAPDGRGKARVQTPKMALGPIGNGAVRLGPAAPAIGLAEGIETALSVAQLFRIPCWAALGSRLDRVALPECVVEVQIFGDNGAAGHAAAEKAAVAIEQQGLRIFLRFPPEDYGDWNDFLQGRKTEAT